MFHRKHPLKQWEETRKSLMKDPSIGRISYKVENTANQRRFGGWQRHKTEDA